MPGLLDLLFVVLLPAILCGGALLASRSLSGPFARALPPLGFGLGYLCAHVGLVGLPALPSAGVTPPARDWLAWVVLAATLLGPSRARVPEWIVDGAPAAALAWLSLRGMADRASAFALLLAATAAAQALARRSRGPGIALAWLASAVGTSLASLFARSGLMAELAGSAAACLGAATVLGFADRRSAFPASGASIVVLALGGALLNGRFHGELPAASALLLLGSIAMPLLAEIPALARGAAPGGPRAWKQVLLSLLPAAAGAALAWSPGSDPY